MSFELNGCVRVARAGFLGLILCLFVAENLFAQTNITVTITKINGLTTQQAVTVTATITNDSQNGGVTWSATGGAFSNTTLTSTLYTAPSTPGTYSLTATSVTDPTKSMSTSFGVTDLAGVFTYHNNLMRDGVNSSEYELTPQIFSSTPFGKLFSCTVDGAIYAQPLWMANLAISGPADVHNVVFVATQHDSLYAFDADVNATPCTPLWHVSLIDAAHGGSASETSIPSGTTGHLVGKGDGDITPEVGVTGTPVIDPTSNTLYVVSKSVDPSGPTFYQRLHAINILNGSERVTPPLSIDSSISFPGTGPGAVNGRVTFDPRQQNQRAGLALVNGGVYVAWASHEDNPTYYGWVMGFNASTLAQTAVLNVTPNFGYGGIWMGGGAPAADASNYLYLITGNGQFNANSTTAPNNDYGDSFLKLTSNLTVSQYFTPTDYVTDQGNDQDFGAGGAALLVDQPSGPVQHLVIGGGKDGYLYLLNRDSMGGLGDTKAWQRFNFGYPIFATGAFWNNALYMAGVHGHLQALPFNTSTGKFNTSNVWQSATSFGFPGSTPSVSALGATNGIVWALDQGNYCTPGLPSPGCGPVVLHAYDATNLTEIWNSIGTGNAAGNAVKFTVPTVANGKVYVGTRGNNTGGSTTSTSVPGELDAYGLLGGPVPAPTITSVSPNSGMQAQSFLSVTISGSNFLASPVCSFGAGVTVNSCTYHSSTQITANVSIAANATVGSNTVTVTDAGGQVVSLAGGFTITANTNPLAPILVNAGGPAYTDSQGQVWSADKDFSGGSVAATNSAIANTADPTLYKTERYGAFLYQFQVLNGSYNILLKFAEIYWTKAGQRIFSVSINGTQVLTNFDIVAAAGAPLTAIDKTFPVTVTNGLVSIQFITGPKDLPKVSAIEVKSGSAVSIQISPSTQTLFPGQSHQFSATVTGTTNLGVTWTYSPQVGTLVTSGTTAGLYTAPSTITTSQTINITATSVADTTQSSSATVTLLPAFSAILVNSGGPAYTDTAGNHWNADEDFSGGSVAATNSAIANTADPTLYKTERYGPFLYQFQAPNGSYNVLLKFAEIYWTKAGQRIFSVSINGTQVLTNFDIVAAAGAPLTAIDKTFPVTVTNGLVSIQFITGSKDLPKVSAIEVH